MHSQTAPKIIFQSTLPRGERPPDPEADGAYIRFQSTLPRGERHVSQIYKHLICKFQSTLPRGERRVLLNCGHNPTDISIHAPTRGATQEQGVELTILEFQSTLPRGERRLYSTYNQSTIIFQSTLPRGERQQFSPKSSLFSQQKLSKIFNLNNKLF